MGKDMIFEFYFRWLNKFKRINKFTYYLSKPLGLCTYCNTAWIAIVVYFYYFPLGLPIFLFIGLTNVMRLLLFKIFET